MVACLHDNPKGEICFLPVQRAIDASNTSWAVNGYILQQGEQSIDPRHAQAQADEVAHARPEPEVQKRDEWTIIMPKFVDSDALGTGLQVFPSGEGLDVALALRKRG